MSWEKVKLSDVCEIIAGQSPPSSTYNSNGKGLPFFQGKADFGTDYPKVRMWCNQPNKISEPNDVLLSVRAPVGPTNICDVKSCIGRGLAAIRSNGKTHSKYVYYYFKSIEPVLSTKGNGSTFSAITISDVKDLQIPLPPLHIQKQIANILDKADALRKKDQQLLQKYDELAQAIFIDMFGDPMKNEKGWDIGTIREIASEVKYGTSKPAEEGGEYPYLRMNNITYSGEWDFSSLKYISVSNSEKEKYSLRKNDVVFNRTNSKELVGKTAVYDRVEEVIIAGYLIRLRCNKKGNSFYVSAFLNSKYGKTTLLNMCKSIVGMANINAQELQNIKILMPPIEVQNNFETQLKSLKKVKNLVAQSKSENLFQSLLQKAFTGEIIHE